MYMVKQAKGGTAMTIREKAELREEQFLVLTPLLAQKPGAPE